MFQGISGVSYSFRVILEVLVKVEENGDGLFQVVLPGPEEHDDEDVVLPLQLHLRIPLRKRLLQICHVTRRGCWGFGVWGVIAGKLLRELLAGGKGGF